MYGTTKIVVISILLLIAIQGHFAVNAKGNEEFDEVEFFSNREKGNWVSFLNLKTTVSEKQSPVIPTLRIKARLSSQEQFHLRQLPDPLMVSSIEVIQHAKPPAPPPVSKLQPSLPTVTIHAVRTDDKVTSPPAITKDYLSLPAITVHGVRVEGPEPASSRTTTSPEGSSTAASAASEQITSTSTTTTSTTTTSASMTHPPSSTTASEPSSTTAAPSTSRPKEPVGLGKVDEYERPEKKKTRKKPILSGLRVTIEEKEVEEKVLRKEEEGEKEKEEDEEYEYDYESEEEEETPKKKEEKKDEKDMREQEKEDKGVTKEEQDKSKNETMTMKMGEKEKEKEAAKDDTVKGVEEEEEEKEEEGDEQDIRIKEELEREEEGNVTVSTTAEPFHYREVVYEVEKVEEPGFMDEFRLPTPESKIVISDISQIDTRLFEKELMSMRVRDEQVEHIREMLLNSTRLEDDTGESHNDLGGSFILPLLQAIRYDNNTVPLIFRDIPVHVRTQLKILHVGNFDSHLMEYTVDTEMNMRWYDLRLANNYSRPVRIREKPLIDLIWRPDPYFVNSKYSYFHRVSFPNFRMIITPNGLVSYTMRVTLLPSCPMIFCRYPHDRQECDLRMSSIAYPRSLVHFTWHSHPFSLQHELSLPELHVTRMWADLCTVQGKLIHSSCLRLVLNLKREGGRFIVEKYMPSALAMMFGWVAPYVPYHYEEVRIVTPITVLLTLVQMEKGDQQVRTSYLTSIDVWFGVMKIFTVLSLIESLSVLAMIKRSRALKKMAERAANEYERSEMMGRRRQMRKCVLRLDHFARIASPILFFAFLLHYVFFLTQGDEAECVSKQIY